MNQQFLITTKHISNGLQEMLCNINPNARFMDLSSTVEHYIDCYLYGSTYERHCHDPLMDIFNNLSVPSEYRMYIKDFVLRQTENLIDNAIGKEINGDFEYVVTWTPPNTGILERIMLGEMTNRVPNGHYIRTALHKKIG